MNIEVFLVTLSAVAFAAVIIFMMTREGGQTNTEQDSNRQNCRSYHNRRS
jgi:hypothetical protein